MSRILSLGGRPLEGNGSRCWATTPFSIRQCLETFFRFCDLMRCGRHAGVGVGLLMAWVGRGQGCHEHPTRPRTAHITDMWPLMLVVPRLRSSVVGGRTGFFKGLEAWGSLNRAEDRCRGYLVLSRREPPVWLISQHRQAILQSSVDTDGVPYRFNPIQF